MQAFCEEKTWRGVDKLRPVLVVSYSDETRRILSAALHAVGVVPASCCSFVEAESLAMRDLYSGILVDLPSTIKAKGEEKIVVTSLGNIFPVMRVKIVGSMFIPMMLSGGTAQAKSLDEFLLKHCLQFVPRRLRSHKRHQLHAPALLGYKGDNHQVFTYDLSWGGAFLVSNRPDRYEVGDDITVTMPTVGASISGAISRVQPWGQHKVMPGIGVRWHMPLQAANEEIFKKILRTSRAHDYDRIIG